MSLSLISLFLSFFKFIRVLLRSFIHLSTLFSLFLSECYPSLSLSLEDSERRHFHLVGMAGTAFQTQWLWIGGLLGWSLLLRIELRRSCFSLREEMIVSLLAALSTLSSFRGGRRLNNNTIIPIIFFEVHQSPLLIIFLVLISLLLPYFFLCLFSLYFVKIEWKNTQIIHLCVFVCVRAYMWASHSAVLRGRNSRNVLMGGVFIVNIVCGIRRRYRKILY